MCLRIIWELQIVLRKVCINARALYKRKPASKADLYVGPAGIPAQGECALGAEPAFMFPYGIDLIRKIVNLWAQQESNLHNQLRRLVFYPLNYGPITFGECNLKKPFCQSSLRFFP